MSSIASSYNRLLQSVSYVINRHSNLPLVSKFQIYDTLRDYTMEQEFRIQQLEKRVLELENNLSIITNSKECITLNEKKK
jgi:hypothetical protein